MMATPSTTVLRQGRELDIPSREIVPGDVIVLQTGSAGSPFALATMLTTRKHDLLLR